MAISQDIFQQTLNNQPSPFSSGGASLQPNNQPIFGGEGLNQQQPPVDQSPPDDDADNDDDDDGDDEPNQELSTTESSNKLPNPLGDMSAEVVSILQRTLNDANGIFDGLLRILNGLVSKFLTFIEDIIKNLDITEDVILDHVKCVLKQPLHLMDCFK